MPDQMEVEHIQLNQGTVAQLFKLPQQMIDYLWERIDIAKKKQVCHKKNLDYIPKISHSYILKDPQNLVVPNLYKIVFNQVDNPKMFEFINMEIRKIYKRNGGTQGIEMEPQLNGLWVNFQKKGEFQPIHAHGGMFSFVIWMDIPYNSKDEAKYTGKTNESYVPGGCFSFAISDGTNRSVRDIFIELSPGFNGYCCFFPSDLSHQVYPFYTSDKDRISISGNIMYR